MIRRIKRWYFRRRVRYALTLLSSLEGFMRKADIPRQQRRYFWRQMAHEEDRVKTLETLEKNLGIE